MGREVWNKWGWKIPKKGLFTERVTSSISLAEIDEIRMDRLPQDIVNKENKLNKFYDNVMVEKNVECEEERDLFSGLPDHILDSIISSLSTKEAIRTSVLSRKFEDLWRLSLKKIDLTYEYKQGHKTENFVRQVNNIVELHRCTEIESFRLSGYLPTIYYNNVYYWILFAVTKKVQKLELNLSKGNPYKRRCRTCFRFPFELFCGEKGTTLKHLMLSFCSFSFPLTCASGFSSLSSLTLKYTRLSDENLSCILSSCVSLEWLSIVKCFCSEYLRFASESSPSLRLKHLNISFCGGLEEVDICEAENLMSFEYKGDVLDRLLYGIESAPIKRLSFFPPTERYIGSLYLLDGGLASDFPHLETLLVTDDLPIFSNLKNLSIILVDTHNEDIWKQSQISTMLKASPFLNTFELQFPREAFPAAGLANWNIEKKQPGEFKHEKLKEVVLYNFRVGMRGLAFLKDMISCCPAIEKLEINRQAREYKGDGVWLNIDRPFDEMTRRRLWRRLRKRLPADLHLDVF